MLRIRVKERKLTFKRKRDNYAKKLKQRKLIEYLRKEFQSSTTHGLAYLVNTKIHWFERFFWVLNYVFCIALMYVLMSVQYSRFVETPIVMSVEMDYFNWNISYPAITLCPIHSTDDELLDSLANFSFSESRDILRQNMDFYLKTISVARLESIDSLELPAPEILSHIKPEDYAKKAAEIFKEFDHKTLSTATKWPISVQPSMTEMGMCHVINSNTAVFDNPLKWSDSNVVYAKNNIELSVHDRDFYAQIINFTDNYKIYVTSPDDIILGTTSAYTFYMEGFLSFGVQVWSTRVTDDLRLVPLHLRNCRFKDEPINKRYPIYSYNRCLIECRIRMIVKLCDCIPHFYRPLRRERICNLEELKMCLLIYKKDIMTLTASSETLTSVFEKFGNTKNIPRSSRDCNCVSNCETDVYQREHEIFLPQISTKRLRIGVTTFPKVRVVREIIFTFSDLFLRGGGVLNLCIGSSIISIMELLLTVLRIPIYGLKLIIQTAYQIIRKYITTYKSKGYIKS